MIFGLRSVEIHRTGVLASNYIVDNNIISGTAGGRKSGRTKHTEPIEMKRLWLDVTHLFEELLNALTHQQN